MSSSLLVETLQARRTLDLHEQLVGVRETRTHLAAVVLQGDLGSRGLGTLETRVDLVYSRQEHRNELVTRVVLSLAQGVGETQRRNTRHVGAGHRRSLHVAIVRTGQFRAGRGKYAGAFAAREADDLTAGSCNVATLTVAGVVGRQAVGADRRYRDALAVAAREVRDILRLVSGRVDGQTAVHGCTVVLCHEVAKCLDLQRRVLFVLTVGGEVGRSTVRALENRCSVVGCILDGPADNLVRRVGHTREYLARHQAYAVAVARTAGHAGLRRYRCCSRRRRFRLRVYHGSSRRLSDRWAVSPACPT